MPNKTTMPEPVAFLINGKMLFDEIYSTRQQAERVMKSRATSFEGGDEPKLTPLITTDQAEAYKDACVREALENAAMILKANAEACNIDTAIILRANAEAILALMPKESGKAGLTNKRNRQNDIRRI